MIKIETKLFEKIELENGNIEYRGIDVPYKFVIEDGVCFTPIWIKKEFRRNKFIPDIIEHRVSGNHRMIEGFEIKPITVNEYKYMSLEEAELMYKGYELAVITVKELNRIISQCK